MVLFDALKGSIFFGQKEKQCDKLNLNLKTIKLIGLGLNFFYRIALNRYGFPCYAVVRLLKKWLKCTNLGKQNGKITFGSLLATFGARSTR